MCNESGSRPEETLGEIYDRMDADSRKTSAASAMPRRVDTLRWTDAEKAIGAAMEAVEEMPADVRLTDAVVLLGEAKDRVADFVDGVQPPRKQLLSRPEVIDAAVEALNGMLACDPAAVTALFTLRVPCNESLAAHPTCQVHAPGDELPTTVGLLGLLNGVFGIDTNMRGFIAATYEGGKLVRFQRRPLAEWTKTREEAKL